MDGLLLPLLSALHTGSIGLWLGGTLFVSVAVRPSLARLAPDAALRARTALERWTDPYDLATGWAAVVCGALYGVALSRAHEALGLATRWGWAIAAGAIVALVLLVPATLSLAGVARGRLTPRTLTGVPRIAGLLVALALMTLARFS